MKIPKARQMSSGNWFIQLRLDGKSITVTNKDKAQCEAEAMGIKSGLLKAKRNPQDMTLGQAFDKYIEARIPVLSPATIRGYKKLKKNCFTDIMQFSLKLLSQEQVQKSVNSMAKKKSPKYITNAHGLLSAVLKEYYPEFRLTTVLPPKKRPKISLPEDGDIQLIMEAIKGREIELPILMALWMGMRVSEIRGATFDCIKDHRLHINKAIVDGVKDEPALKYTKTYSSDRWIKIPEYIEALISDLPYSDGFIVRLNSSQLRNRFYRIQVSHNIKQCSVHALRHANAAVMLQLGIPNKYAQARGGWSTDNVLKTVYQYTMQDKMEEVNQTVDKYFSDKIR